MSVVHGSVLTFVPACLLAVVGGADRAVHNVKVSGIRATLGVRSGTASLEKFSYDNAPPTGSRLRLHLTIDQSFKDRLAQAKKATAAGQWSPISPTPGCPFRNSDWTASTDSDLMTDLAAVLDVDDGAVNCSGVDYGYVQQMTTAGTSQCTTGSMATTAAATTTTPADLSDLSAVDLIHFPVDWNFELADVDVDSDFTPLIDNRPPIPDPGSLIMPTGNIADDQFGFLSAQLPPTASELFPVYEDFSATCAVGDEAPVFSGVEDIWWNTYTGGHVISVQ